MGFKMSIKENCASLIILLIVLRYDTIESDLYRRIIYTASESVHKIPNNLSQQIPHAPFNIQTAPLQGNQWVQSKNNQLPYGNIIRWSKGRTNGISTFRKTVK